MRVLAIAGSLRGGSINRKLLESAVHEAPDHVELDVWEGLRWVPMYNEDHDHDPGPPGVVAMRRAIVEADALLIATPEYNSSIPGVLKNALDWASRPRETSSLIGKPVAVVGASPSAYGAAWAQAEARKVLTASGANVVDEELPVPDAFGAFDDAGRLLDPELRQRFAAILDRLLDGALQRQPA